MKDERKTPPPATFRCMGCGMPFQQRRKNLDQRARAQLARHLMHNPDCAASFAEAGRVAFFFPANHLILIDTLHVTAEGRRRRVVGVAPTGKPWRSHLLRDSPESICWLAEITPPVPDGAVPFELPELA